MQKTFSPQERMKRMEEQNKRVKENMAKIRHKVLVLSGKGGVGKTTVAVNLSVALIKKGYKVGLLDVDIHGPNVPKMLGLEGKRLEAEGGKIVPLLWKDKLRVISMAFLLESKTTPVIWRGPLKTIAIRQFLSDVEWEELDYLIIDSPPGTGDEPLSVCQMIPGVDAAIVVTTPQEVALLDSRKAINFAKELKVKNIGVIENMSGLICPYCGKEILLFKKGGGERIAGELGAEFLGAIPIEVDVVEKGDEGEPVFLTNERMKKSFDKVIEEMEGWLK